MAEPSGALQGHFVSRGPSRAGSQVALGTRLIHPRQRVKAKWNSDFRFGGKTAAASNKASHAASKSLLFSFVLDTFQAISVIFFNSA